MFINENSLLLNIMFHKRLIQYMNNDMFNYKDKFTKFIQKKLAKTIELKKQESENAKALEASKPNFMSDNKEICT